MSIATTLPIGEEINPGQFRLSQIQIINWGTFHGRHSMYVDRAGTLLTGHPGVGKSTLFDGIQHIFYASPRLNESAHEASNRKDRRTTFSYMRGRKIKTDDGVIFQRPSSTWSATVLVFEDGLGRHVTIAALFDLPANGLEGQVGKHYVIHDRPLDTAALENHGSRRFSSSSLNTALPGAETFDVHRTFAERFRRKLGIHNDKAFSLLRTLQNGKGLDKGVNRFFRYEVLDKPSTLTAAAAAVEDFNHLSGIYRQLEDAREQRDALAPVPDLHRKHHELSALHNRTVDLQKNQLPLLRHQFQNELLTTKAATLSDARANKEEQIKAATTAKEALAASVASLSEQHANHGGRAIEGLEKDIRSGKRELLERQRLESEARADLDSARIEYLWSEKGLDAARTTAAAGVEHQLAETQTARTREYEAVAASVNLKAQQRALLAEIDSYQRRSSNIDPRSASARRAICAATGLAPEDMPFAGELVDIGTEHTVWRAAAEKVLRSLATTLLVRGSDIDAVTSAIDGLDGLGKLRWINLGMSVQPTKREQPGQDHLVSKLDFHDSEPGSWLREKITADYAFTCVPDDAALHQYARAISRAGTVKLSSTVFERDTRSISASDYLLGFNNVAKIAQLQQQVTGFAADHAESAAAATQSSLAREESTQRLAAMQRIAEDARTFDQLDSGALMARQAVLQATLDQAIAGSATLAQLRASLAEANTDLEAAVGNVAVLHHDFSGIKKELSNVRAVLSGDTQPAQAADWALEAFSPYLLDGGPTSLDELELMLSHVAVDLGERITTIKERQFRAEGALSEIFKSFARQFGPLMSSSHGTGAEAAQHYEELYRRIVSEGLPQRQEQFKEYFNNRSYERFSDLLQLLEEERRSIEERILPLNQILADVPFEKGSRLRLEVKTTIPDEARVFRGELKEALGNAYTKATEDTMAASYLQLERLVNALQDPTMAHWADTVLDVRQHVTISCNEHRPNGEVEVGLEPGTLSGGEGQRFTSFIMGAALAYQLGIDTQGYSTYGTVMIDEAFIQANSEYAGAGINALQEFGFQLLLAAPEDKVDLSRHLGSITDIIKHPQANVSGFLDTGRSPATATDIVLGEPS